jgi:hypothetical protein
MWKVNGGGGQAGNHQKINQQGDKQSAVFGGEWTGEDQLNTRIPHEVNSSFSLSQAALVVFAVPDNLVCVADLLFPAALALFDILFRQLVSRPIGKSSHGGDFIAVRSSPA